jgi:methylphosphotriester-DNA--protein-cysteine methyltransferase
VTDLQLDYAVPDASLSDHITLFYRFRSDLPVFEETERADRAQLRFVLHDGGGEYCFPDGHVQRAMDVHIVGPTTGPRIIRADRPVRVFGAGITPCGWAALIGSDASSMVNRLVDAADLFGERVIEAREALRAAPDLAAMEAIAAALLRALIRDSGGETLRFVRQVDAWLKASTSPEIESLTAATGLSCRQIERKCNRLYGVPPKLLARKYRALRAAVALVLDQDQVQDGFYDQSHLIREIKEFTGLTPRQLKSEPGLIAELSIGLRHNLTGQIDLLVSGA